MPHPQCVRGDTESDAEHRPLYHVLPRHHEQQQCPPPEDMKRDDSNRNTHDATHEPNPHCWTIRTDQPYRRTGTPVGLRRSEQALHRIQAHDQHTGLTLLHGPFQASNGTGMITDSKHRHRGRGAVRGCDDPKARSAAPFDHHRTPAATATRRLSRGPPAMIGIGRARMREFSAR
jgi:DNA segregation ATPase FtsK/SpoIIIE-like protein